MSDTEDLIQETLAQTFKQLPRIELNDEDALHAYLRQAILNRIRNELRRASRHPVRAELDPEVPGASTSPLEAAIGAQRLERYERSLALLASCDAHAPEDPVEPAPTTGGATLRYDATAGHFIQNWKVPQTPGACYMVRMTTAQDGLALTARFKVR